MPDPTPHTHATIAVVHADRAARSVTLCYTVSTPDAASVRPAPDPAFARWFASALQDLAGDRAPGPLDTECTARLLAQSLTEAPPDALGAQTTLRVTYAIRPLPRRWFDEVFAPLDASREVLSCAAPPHEESPAHTPLQRARQAARAPLPPPDPDRFEPTDRATPHRAALLRHTRALLDAHPNRREAYETLTLHLAAPIPRGGFDQSPLAPVIQRRDALPPGVLAMMADTLTARLASTTAPLQPRDRAHAAALLAAHTKRPEHTRAACDALFAWTPWTEHTDRWGPHDPLSYLRQLDPWRHIARALSSWVTADDLARLLQFARRTRRSQRPLAAHWLTVAVMWGAGADEALAPLLADALHTLTRRDLDPHDRAMLRAWLLAAAPRLTAHDAVFREAHQRATRAEAAAHIAEVWARARPGA